MGMQRLISRIPGRWIAWMVENLGFLIPFERLRETRTLIAFHHPRPVYPLHILIMPRQAIASLEEIGPRDSEFIADLFRIVAELVRELNLEKCGYRLIVNGGKYQQVGQLHFHLISEAETNP